MATVRTRKFKIKRGKEKVLPSKEKGKEKRFLYPIAIVIIILSLAFSAYTISTAARPLSERGIKACQTDSDCIEVPADCCGCANGGKSQAINKKYKGYFAEKRAKECQDIACLTVYVCDDEVRPRCISRQCSLKSDNPPR